MSLKIRPEQVQAFQPIAEAGFVRRLTDYVRKVHGDAIVRIPSGAMSIAQVPTTVLSIMIQNGIARGRRYGLSWESSLAAFVVIMIIAAPNFDEHPLIQRVLRQDDAAPERRIDGIWRRISSQNWKAVESYYDPGAWGLHGDKE